MRNSVFRELCGSLYLVLFSLLFQNTAFGNVTQNGDTLIIVAFGNSITAERGTIDKVFAQRLPELLKLEGIHTKVINSGIPGSHTGRIEDNNRFKIRHGRDRFNSDVMSYNPDIAIIGFGTNDSYIDSVKRGGKSRISLGDYRSNLKYFIQQLQASGTTIVLMAPNILGSNYPDFQNKRLLKYVKVVRSLARKYNTRLVDNYQLFVDYQKRNGQSFDELMLDGCHPNDAGHTLIAGALVKEVVAVITSE